FAIRQKGCRVKRARLIKIPSRGELICNRVIQTSGLEVRRYMPIAFKDLSTNDQYFTIRKQCSSMPYPYIFQLFGESKYPSAWIIQLCIRWSIQIGRAADEQNFAVGQECSRMPGAHG